ncbi:hypothetical protein, partial [Streptomyces sp. PT19]|uniref:hypothetical protein n=1 Tax=Streptomyces sp. PT19 TaxID=3452239 RepID=UPI003F7DADB5
MLNALLHALALLLALAAATYALPYRRPGSPRRTLAAAVLCLPYVLLYALTRTHWAAIAFLVLAPPPTRASPSACTRPLRTPHSKSAPPPT